MRKTLTKLTVAVLSLTGTMFAQQDPQFTQFMHSRLIYNPAYAGTNQSICANAMYRKQWVSFPGAPTTMLLSADAYNAALGGIGFGLNIMHDAIGADKTIYARGAFAKHFQVGADGNGTLSLGLDVGILQKQINGVWIAPQTLQDPSIPNNPQALGGTGAPNLNRLVPDFGFGAYYTIPRKMYVGISASHLSAATLKGSSNGTPADPTKYYDLAFKMARHYYLVGGYTFLLGSADHTLTPNLKVKSDGSSTQLDINATYEFQSKVWFGLTYRMQDAIAPMLGYRQDMGKNGILKIGYAYDVTTSKIKGYSSGTHEIFVNYCIKLVKPPTRTMHQSDRILD